MQRDQALKQDAHLKTDLLAWRVLSAKKRENEISRHKAYNTRPRLRSEAHH